MDVTFFEEQSYYNNSHLQGVNTSEEDFLNISTLDFVHDYIDCSTPNGNN